jgi:hypothetical protein
VCSYASERLSPAGVADLQRSVRVWVRVWDADSEG